MNAAARLSIETPESVRFDYELAGVGARALALALDFLLQYLVLGLGFVTFVRLSEIVPSARPVVWLLLVFAINWFYFVAFELAMGGQTPGKRWVGIRVVRSGGYPVTWGAVLGRNLLRVVDSIPGSYGVALAVAFLDPEHRRLGDLLAGTVVVRERKAADWSAATTRGGAAAHPAWTDTVLALHLDEATRELVSDYVARRERLDPAARARVRAEIVETVLDRVATPGARGELLGRLGAANQDAFLDTIAAT